jgi:hypothetical protein
MTLKLGSRRRVLIDSIEVPAASANVSDEHVDTVEDDPAPTTVRDDAIPHVCDSNDDGASFISGRSVMSSRPSAVRLLLWRRSRALRCVACGSELALIFLEEPQPAFKHF